jgi:serine protease AprX
MYRSISTVKADAARRSYDALGEGITWVVIDSGIDARHQHFRTHDTLSGEVAGLHRDFTKSGEPQRRPALSDPFGHGTHAAGIIAGGLPADLPPDRVRVFERVFDPAHPETPASEEASVEPLLLSGIAPRCKLISLKVLNEHGVGTSMNLLRALEYVRKDLIGGRLLRVQGVHIGLGFEWDERWFKCGETILCSAVNDMVRAGVVVVTTAGNTGYGSVSALTRQTNTGFLLTINDPGNAELAITVGSTHRDMPHRFGVSYFSSKGPTLDGRLKPDLVAPGEDIVSCAAGQFKQQLRRQHKSEKLSSNHILYGADSGTSLASAHVSGVIASFLSVHREFIGRPDEVKRIFLESATSLGRRPEFQGHGLVDLMRALQMV